MKALVVYYSLTGKTRLVAEAVAEALNAKLVEIRETKPRKPRAFTYLSGSFAALANRGSSIHLIDVDLREHERVFIGSPVWASRPAPAVNSFIYGSDLQGRDVIPFFTMGGNDSSQALANISAKIERSSGKVAGSFTITTNKVSNEDIVARAKDAVKEHYGQTV